MDKKEFITVAGKWETDPAMLSYAFNDKLGCCVDACSPSEWANIRAEIERALGMNLSFVEATEEETEDVSSDNDERLAIVVHNEVLQRENTKMKAKLELLQGMYNDLMQKVFEK